VEKANLKPKAKRKRKPKPKFSKSKLEMDYLFHLTRQEVFWSEFLHEAYSLDMERLKKAQHKSYIV
jgi:hypothetical protein